MTIIFFSSPRTFCLQSHSLMETSRCVTWALPAWSTLGRTSEISLVHLTMWVSDVTTLQGFAPPPTPPPTFHLWLTLPLGFINLVHPIQYGQYRLVRASLIRTCEKVISCPISIYFLNDYLLLSLGNCRNWTLASSVLFYSNLTWLNIVGIFLGLASWELKPDEF